MIRQDEACAIYEEFLNGDSIAAIAKKHHHRRITIEATLREMTQIAESEVTRCMEWGSQLADDCNFLSSTTVVLEYLRQCNDDGEKAARKWFNKHYDSMKALKAKRRLLRGCVRSVYDDKGLLVNFVPQAVN